MASSTVVTVTDDLDGSKGAETVRFALDGADYEIDLTGKNRKALEKALAPYVAAAREAPKVTLPASGTSRNRAKSASAGNRTPKDELAAIRAWAAGAGIHVGDRGRIANDVRVQYAAANSQQ